MKINYQELLNNALKSVVKEALIWAQFNGLGEDTHFYITFRTNAPGVILPDFLRLRYPEVITIVLQYSYNNLNVSDTEFGVQLTFDGRPFFIKVPYSAMLEFKDPSADMILPFHQGNTKPVSSNDIELPMETIETRDTGRVVSLDAWRKKK